MCSHNAAKVARWRILYSNKDGKLGREGRDLQLIVLLGALLQEAPSLSILAVERLLLCQQSSQLLLPGGQKVLQMPSGIPLFFLQVTTATKERSS
jgi:hypothetical protein